MSALSAEYDAALAGLRKTWPAFQKVIDIDWLGPTYTEIVREGWPKPTIYREHEVIHVLCNVIDNLQRELAVTRPATPGADS